MLAFEVFLEKIGARLVDGSKKEFSTYENVQRTWIVDDIQFPIQIGLIGNKSSNFIGLRYPIVTHLPSDNFEHFLSKIKIFSFKMDKKFNIEEIGIIIKN